MIDTAPAIQVFDQLCEQSQAPPLRSPRQFVEDDVVIPDGPFAGRPYKCDRQPWSRLFLEQMDNPHWLSLIIQGPTQSGKTFSGFCCPIVYHVAERRETFVVGVPDLAMVDDKWQKDIKPIFAASPSLSKLLPTTGAGSRGGSVKDAVHLTNGATLKFLTAGGSDESKAGFTSRVMGITEAKRFSRRAEASVESAPIEQIRGRLLGYRRSQRREYIEGTVGVAEELPWSARATANVGRLFTPCPHCDAWHALERDNLAGFEDASTEEEAADKAHFVCPACESPISDKERLAANQDMQLVLQGQKIEKGKVTGQAIDVRRLFFRYSAYHNLFLDPADFAVEEWRLMQTEAGSEEEDQLERKCCQQIWSIPWEPPEVDLYVIKERDVAKKASELPRSVLPADTQFLTVGIDVSIYRLHWVAIAFRADRTLHVPDYGTIEVLQRGVGNSQSEREKAAEIKLQEQLDAFRDRCSIGFNVYQSDTVLQPQQTWIDAGYMGSVVVPWTIQAGDGVLAAIGRGVGQYAGEKYSHPSQATPKGAVRFVGADYHLRMHDRFPTVYSVVNADAWKMFLHRRIKSPTGQPGSITLFQDLEKHHSTIERHWRSETLTRELHPSRGFVERWTNTGKANHYLDASYLACAAGHFCGFTVVAQNQPPAPAAVDEPETEAEVLMMPDGRPY